MKTAREELHALTAQYVHGQSVVLYAGSGKEERAMFVGWSAVATDAAIVEPLEGPPRCVHKAHISLAPPTARDSAYPLLEQAARWIETHNQSNQDGSDLVAKIMILLNLWTHTPDPEKNNG